MSLPRTPPFSTSTQAAAAATGKVCAGLSPAAVAVVAAIAAPVAAVACARCCLSFRTSVGQLPAAIGRKQHSNDRVQNQLEINFML